MVVLADFVRIDPPPPGHAEMEDQCVAAIAVDQPIFGPAAKRGDAGPGQPLAKIGRKRAAQIRPPRLDRDDAPALEHLGQAANGGLDFGKLGHRRRMANGAQAR